MVFNLDDEENKEKDEQLAGPSNVITPGAGSSISTPAPSKATPQKPTQNFAALLSSNRGTIGKLGQAVGDYVGGKSTAAGDAISSARRNFGSAVEQGTVGLDQSLINRILSNPAGITGADEAAVLRQRDAQYKGPSSLETTEFYSPAQTAVREAEEAGERTKSSAGRQDLLSSIRSKPVGQGVSVFDEAVLYGNSGNRSLLAKKAQETKPFAGLLDSASRNAAEKAAGARTLTEATQTATTGALTTGTENLKTDLRSRLEAARNSASTRITAAQQAADQLGGFRFQVRKNPKIKGKNILQEVYRTSKTGNPKYRDLTPEQIQKLGGNADAIIAQYLQNKTTPFMKAGTDSFLYRPTEDKFSDQALADLGINREALKTLLSPEDMINKYRSKGLIKGQFEKLVAEYFEALGGNADYYTGDMGDAGDYVRSLSPDAELNLANVASTEDYDRLQALNRLGGTQDLFLPTDKSRAGTGQMDLSAMNLGKLNELYLKALQAAVEHSHYQRSVNARSGGDTFIKKAGKRFTEISSKTGLGLPGLPAYNLLKGTPAGNFAEDYAYQKLFGDEPPTENPVKQIETEDELERILNGEGA